MSWSVCYTGTFELCSMGISSLESKKEECEAINKTLWNEILAYMAATPPAYAEDCEGNKYPYAEFLSSRIEELKESISENEQLIARINDCLSVLQEHPDQVTEG